LSADLACYDKLHFVNPAGALHRSRKGSGSPGLSVVAEV
jgi:hypothetical protein